MIATKITMPSTTISSHSSTAQPTLSIAAVNYSAAAALVIVATPWR